MDASVIKKSGFQDVKDLVKALESASLLPKRGKSYKIQCKSFHSSLKINSWKFNEWDYGKNNIDLPCEARGLFITDDQDNPEIIGRGYDKFFNVDEIFKNSWAELEKNTTGPYEVTVKENGCIVFISGRSDGEIIVCSKHSTGPRDDTDRNHAEAGEEYLRRQLNEQGVDIKRLAKRLYELNCTAVAEYCDDSFEEHILEYSRNNAGLYLHGLNFNTPEFATMPMAAVAEFAKEYGFKVVDCLMINDIHQLRLFLEDCATKGHYNNMEVEGFVIRCKTKAGRDYFFKYKFEEPYLLYRQWREVTKDYINTRSRVFNFSKHKYITNKYLDFVIPILEADRALCEQFLKGHGIIKLRNMFLESYGMSGFEILNNEALKELDRKNALDREKVDEFTKFIFFPIATVGCGKTTVSLTLRNIFGDSWRHVQNDDITGKDKAKLMKDSLEQLSKEGVKAVIVDRNNHQLRERQQLFEWFNQYKEEYLPYDCNVKFICLSFIPGTPDETQRQITSTRVLARGDNHQSIKVQTDGEKKALSIINGFIKRFQPLDTSRSPDNLFDFVIELEVENAQSSLINTKLILEKLNQKYPTLVQELPADEAIEQAFQVALQYKPTITKIVGGKKNNRSERYKPLYFSADLDDNKYFRGLVESVLNSNTTKSVNTLTALMAENNIQPDFHITLIHLGTVKKGTKADRDQWSEYVKRYSDYLLKSKNNNEGVPTLIPTKDTVKFKLESLIWDENIVTVTVQLDHECITDENGNKVTGLSCNNTIAHITIGIRKDGVHAVYSNVLCQKVHDALLKNKDLAAEGLFQIKFEQDIYLNASVSINF
ncbi:HBR433Wp [Eremothecium sinecaudum]|uniref:tRNA ligase n=1 Tax=Eremothecium sinecaudum TaxID=45286 RepID=A0A120K1F5_9SACH|nr:HBR433Wp [Eremothecium sinecaudum]AMD19334.1 HBR433Wp [Eremothecium sinecaudum]